jgi:hypothetical protein
MVETRLRSKNILLGAAALLLASTTGWAAPHGQPSAHQDEHEGHIAKAPEIDASTGVSAIALLAGVVLVLREKTRHRDS